METILTHTVTWINLEDIMPSVISQSSHSKIVRQSVSFKKLKYKLGVKIYLVFKVLKRIETMLKEWAIIFKMKKYITEKQFE